MIKAGLWVELGAIVGFIVGLRLGSLLGQLAVAVILMIVLEIVLTPIFIRTRIPHLGDLQRAVVGIATARLEPGQLPLAFGGGGHDFRLTESTTTAVLVIIAWLIGWTVLGAWRMTTRDAQAMRTMPRAPRVVLEPSRSARIDRPGRSRTDECVCPRSSSRWGYRTCLRRRSWSTPRGRQNSSPQPEAVVFKGRTAGRPHIAGVAFAAIAATSARSSLSSQLGERPSSVQ
jgi:hypothetical protein